MHLIDDSLAMVLLGDWNKLYTQPEWFAKTVFEEDSIDIGVENTPQSLVISYKCNDILIHPTQEKVIFTALQTSDATLDYLSKCIQNFINNSYTPQIVAYGINAKYTGSTATMLAGIIDNIPDSSVFIQNGYVIESTNINRSLKKGDQVINVNMAITGSDCLIHFNEHHGDNPSVPTVNGSLFKSFLNSCQELLVALGYELDGDENE